jgi:hypothetical protein
MVDKTRLAKMQKMRGHTKTERKSKGNNMNEQKEWKPTKEWLDWYLAPSIDYRKVYGDAFVWTEQEKQLMLLQKLKEQK